MSIAIGRQILAAVADHLDANPKQWGRIETFREDGTPCCIVGQIRFQARKAVGTGRGSDVAHNAAVHAARELLLVEVKPLALGLFTWNDEVVKDAAEVAAACRRAANREAPPWMC
jgi:hypothetical protein